MKKTSFALSLLLILFAGGCATPIEVKSPEVMPDGYGVQNYSGYIPSGFSKGDQGLSYSGEFIDNKRHGRGKVIYSNGDVLEGTWTKYNEYTKEAKRLNKRKEDCEALNNTIMHSTDASEFTCSDHTFAAFRGGLIGVATCTRASTRKVYYSMNTDPKTVNADLSKVKRKQDSTWSDKPDRFYIDGREQQCYADSTWNKGRVASASKVATSSMSDEVDSLIERNKTRPASKRSFDMIDVLLLPVKIAVGALIVLGEVADSPAGQVILDNQEAKNQKEREKAAYEKGKRDGKRKADRQKRNQCNINPNYPGC